MTVYLEIATALIVTFLMLSLLVSAVAEVLALALNQRGRLLRTTLTELAGSETLLRQLLGSAALRPILRARSGSDAPGAWRFPDALPALAVADALLEVDAGTRTDAPGALLARAATGSREMLAEVYGEVIGQLSVRYKRRQQGISILIGFGLAAAMNLNVLAMAQALQTDDARRLAIAAHAEGLAARGLPPGTGIDPDAAEPEDAAAATARLAERLEELDAFAEVAGLGWQEAPVTWTFGQWLFALLSWAAAGLASALGAPFWFDLLTRTSRALSIARQTGQRA